MSEISSAAIKLQLYLDGCTDLARGMAYLLHQLTNGVPYSDAVQPWRTAIPQLFDERAARRRRREETRQAGSPMPEHAVEPLPVPRGLGHALRIPSRDRRLAYAK